MKSNLAIVLVVLLLTALSVQAADNTDFKVADLSREGQGAYNKLLDARTFSIGLVGWEARQSPREIALRTLLHEKKALKSLRSLLQNATPEGGLYALFGLRMLDIKTFNQELTAYKSKPEPPERPRYAAAVLERPSRLNRVRAGEVIIQKGCVALNASWRKVISSIEAGIYDEEFRLNKTGVDYILQNGTVIRSN